MSNNPAQELDSTTEDLQEQTTEVATDTEVTDASTEAEDVFYDIEGEEVSLETIQTWKSGHMKDADYTAKTQTLAEEKNTVSSLRTDLEGRFEALGAIESELESLVMGDAVNIDQFDEDTTEYLKAKDARDKRKEEFSGLSRKFADMQNAYFERGHQELSEALGWSDPVKRDGDKKLILGYVKSRGVTDKEFARVTNPKIMAALLDAAKYQQLQEQKPETVKRVKQAPKAVKPGAKEAPKTQSLAERMYPNMKK